MISIDSIFLYAIDDETPPKTDFLKPRESKSQPPAIAVSITLALVIYMYKHMMKSYIVSHKDIITLMFILYYQKEFILEIW